MSFLQVHKLHFWMSASLQYWVPSSVQRGLTERFCETILTIKFTQLSKTHSERKSQRYKIYIHKGTAILLKPAMLQYNRVQSVPFMQQSSLTNVTPLPEKWTAQGVYPSLLVRRVTSYYFISSKAATGISMKYIKCFFFLPKFARLSKLFLTEKVFSN